MKLANSTKRKIDFLQKKLIFVKTCYDDVDDDDDDDVHKLG